MANTKDNGDQPQETSPGRPERPIETTAEDALGREGFVRRLVSALINLRTKKATGVVVGITGRWGGGKSSILNLVNERIKKEFEDAVVVRFDPWLIAGRNDLISAFIGELLGAIKAEPKAASLLKSATGTLAKYGQHVAPAINWVAPGVGSAIAGAIGAVRTRIWPEESLTALRAKLVHELKEAAVPIVILIDEIDRIEDAEIRTIAQLVRAVADFPGISYLLAYDPDRVAQALGAGAPEREIKERGRAYLEKIVQLQIPLPVIFDDELLRLITSELEKLTNELGLPSNFAAIERYNELLQIVVGDCVATPRDVSRLIGTYHALAGMLTGEVDWIDLLGYSVLMIKAPTIVDSMRRNPGDFASDFISHRDVERFVARQELDPSERLKALLPEGEDPDSYRRILAFLFPTFADPKTGRRASEHPDALSSRRPLLTTLRLGLIPGAYPRRAIEEFVRGTSEEVATKLASAFGDDTIEQLVDRLDDLYPDLVGQDHVRFWKGVAAFVRKPDCEWMTSYKPMESLARSLASILENAVARDEKVFAPIAQKVFVNLRGTDDVLTAMWLRKHIFVHGLFGQSSRSERRPFLTKEQTEAVALDMSQALRPAHISGNLLPCRWDLQPVYTMINTGVWDDLCRLKTDEALKDGRAVDGLTLMLYGGSYTNDRSTVAKICSLEPYLEAVRQRLETTDDSQPHVTVVAALKKAASGGFFS